jgi:hypothetical protein
MRYHQIRFIPRGDLAITVSGVVSKQACYGYPLWPKPMPTLPIVEMGYHNTSAYRRRLLREMYPVIREWELILIDAGDVADFAELSGV